MRSSTDASAGEMKRIGVLVGDRLCATCGFNLVGQTIVREPHYGMLMVRCPECGTAAATQEYPVLGRWAGRWAMVLAAAWLIVLLIAVGLSSLFLFLPSIGVVEDGSRTLAESIAAEYDTWQAAQPPKPVTPRVRAGKVKTVVANGQVITVRPATPADVALATPAAPGGPPPIAGAGFTDGSADAEEADEAGAPNSTAEDPAADPAVTASGVQTIAPVIVPPTPPPPVAVQRAGIYQSLDRQWVDTADFGAILAKRGGVFASVDAIGYRWLAIEAIVAAVLGVVWSVLLFGARRSRLPLVIPIILALSCAWVAIAYSELGGAWASSRDLAQRLLVIPTSLLTLGLAAVVMAAAMMVGRPIVRTLIRILLPPRMRGSLAGLWICDGLPAPTSRN